MLRSVLTIALALLVAGCSQRSADLPASSLVARTKGVQDRPSTGNAISRKEPGYANLPDRGALIAYAGSPPRQDGAYLWHRAVGISEQHALQAITGAWLTVRTPAGEDLRFEYERHVEHPSGDWTWVGRIRDGAAADEAVITFGEKAVFGSISQPGKDALKLTVLRGVAWLIETDAAAIGQIRNSATRPRKQDYLIPPKMTLARTRLRSGTNPEANPIATQRAVTANATAGFSDVSVDLVLGYTPGFAAYYGGQSQAVTRLNNLVAIANQAYVNSQLELSVRLVHALQVDYADNTNNGTALEQLTGFRAPSTPITPAPQFSALRAARDQYGADLVSLVRKFNDPENGGCGIAWLIGGGQTGIDRSDEFFGYSVVSDGEDVGSDGRTYFCRDETLAHEIGHNMGSQHDRGTATNNGILSYGLYPYSFGHKTTAGGGNFYTVMAYGDSGQTRYRVFSNPRTTYCGQWPCGVENQADNARSLVQAAPVVASFRTPAATTARNDVDGDGRSDLLWVSDDGAYFSYWIMQGATRTRIGSQPTGGSYRVLTTGDYNGDGRVDLLWVGLGKGMHVWTGNGTTFQGSYLTQKPDGWKLVGSGDVDGDGKADLLWQRNDGQYVSWWRMNGPAVLSIGSRFVGGYNVNAVGDYNGDRRIDLLWRGGAGEQELHLWTSQGDTFSGHYFSQPPGGWGLVGSGDMNGDGRDDLLWQTSDRAQFGYWHMPGACALYCAGQFVGSSYGVRATGDFDGDLRTDIVWVGAGGDMHFWRSEGNRYSGQYFGAYPGGWTLLGGY